MLLKQKDSAYSRSVQAVSHSLSKPTWMGRTGKTGVKLDLPSANAFFDRVWTFSLTRCWKQRTTSSTSQASSKQTSCMEDVVLTYETLSGSNVRNSARKSVRILISVCLCKNCTLSGLKGKIHQNGPVVGCVVVVRHGPDHIRPGLIKDQRIPDFGIH